MPGGSFSAGNIASESASSEDDPILESPSGSAVVEFFALMERRGS